MNYFRKMRLVLIDTWAAPCSLYSDSVGGYLNNLDFFISESVMCSIDLNQCQIWNDDVGRKLVSEILCRSPYSSPLTLRILLLTIDQETRAVGIGKIFQHSLLLEDDVTFSLHLECLTNTNKIINFGSVEGMKINRETQICQGTSSIGFDIVDEFCTHIKASGVPKFHLKLVVDIPDKSAAKKRKRDHDDDDGADVAAPRKLLEEGIFSDVIIIAKNGAKIKAHKSFLSACSPVLKAMFETKMKESETGRLKMTDVSEQGVNAFLRYLYYEDMERPKENTEVAFELLRTGHMYEMGSLVTKMTNCLMERKNEDLTMELAFKIYMFTRNIGSAMELKTKAVDVLKAKLDELESLQEYKDLFEKPSNSKIAMALCRDLAKGS